MILGSCPDCGFVAELAAFAAGPLAKEQLVAALKLPREIHSELIPYLGLFRPGPGKRALADPKAARILRELADLVGAGSVQWKKGAARPCSARLWAQGMRQMVEMRDRLKLPIESHGYLTAIVYDEADQAAAKGEKATRQAEANHGRPAKDDQDKAPLLQEEAAGLSDAAREQIRLTQALISGIGRKM